MNTATENITHTGSSSYKPVLTLNIAGEFSRFPGSRYRQDGPYSGEEFRDTLLLPRFKEALDKRMKLIINLDGAAGYATSFLEEAFGGLAREFGTEAVLRHLEFHSYDEPLLEREIQKYISEAGRRE
ncbi:MAG: STAS-like domain-containing protein [Blastocatellia bacterium]